MLFQRRLISDGFLLLLKQQVVVFGCDLFVSQSDQQFSFQHMLSIRHMNLVNKTGHFAADDSTVGQRDNSGSGVGKRYRQPPEQSRQKRNGG